MSAANTELLSCPFCGGEAKVSTLKWGGGYTATALCKNEPNAHYLNTWDEDEAKAVERITEAWNTRHVETCHNTDEDPMYFCCSKCGSTCTVEYGDGGYGRPSFCPSCGRKVDG